jgi:hypothetical protein
VPLILEWDDQGGENHHSPHEGNHRGCNLLWVMQMLLAVPIQAADGHASTPSRWCPSRSTCWPHGSGHRQRLLAPRGIDRITLRSSRGGCDRCVAGQPVGIVDPPCVHPAMSNHTAMHLTGIRQQQPPRPCQHKMAQWLRPLSHLNPHHQGFCPRHDPRKNAPRQQDVNACATLMYALLGPTRA